MKCANCGAELKVGCVYCSVCGKEAQIVSDYNLLEDDFLRGLLKEKKEKIKKKHLPGKIQKGSSSGKKERLQKEDSSGKREKIQKEDSSGKKERIRKGDSSGKSQGKAGKQRAGRRKKKKPIWILAMAALLILTMGAVILVQHTWNHSYDHQIKKAESYQSRKDYRNAEKCLKRALELDSGSEEAKARLAEVYVQQEEYEKAKELLLELLEQEEENREIYEKLIQVYEVQKDYEAIEELGRDIADSEILELFDGYLAKPPVFEPEGGTYQEEIEVELIGEEDCKIYYTLDGSDPKEGKEYTGPILLEPGKNIWIRAVSRNQFGVFGEEKQERFTIRLRKPETPRVTPSGGSFYAPSTIAVTVPEGCRVYYTWDGTAPTRESKQYTEPIGMPEGNNVLSLILVDKYGMASDVLKCNYVYIPQ